MYINAKKTCKTNKKIVIFTNIWYTNIKQKGDFFSQSRYMDTEMNTALTDPSNPRYAEITGRIPAHVWGTSEDMKGPCVFLASDASDYLNGAIIPVDGGYLVK